jgi:hypothetical protein
MPRLVLPALAAAAVLSACTAPPRSEPQLPPAASPRSVAPADGLPRYLCDHGIEFTVRYGEDSALVDAGERGRELLLRDAGGLTPQQTVYSNPRLRAEFGLGPGGDQAILHFPSPPLVARCARTERRAAP